MSKFLITPHFRLHEWVAQEKGYFSAEGLDYEFREAFKGQDLAKAHATANKVGAY
jgi:ABC-type nitrate/sulfonate/bicarbonate transport system substrate-binding protein